MQSLKTDSVTYASKCSDFIKIRLLLIKFHVHFLFCQWPNILNGLLQTIVSTNIQPVMNLNLKTASKFY